MGHDSHAKADGHGHESPAEIRAHAKIYNNVFAALLVLTGATVAVSWIHLPMGLGLAVGLAIACFKSSLVAGFFMHLIGEVKTIWYTIALTVFMFFVCLLLPIATDKGNAGTRVAPVPTDIIREHAHAEGEHAEGDHAESDESAH